MLFFGRKTRRGRIDVWPDETLTDDIGVPGDIAHVYKTAVAFDVYGPKGPPKFGKDRGTWGNPISSVGPPGSSALADWATATAYAAGTVVTFNRRFYRALSGHTSAAAFRTDLAGGKWEHISPPSPAIWTGDPVLAAQVTSTWATANRVVYMRVDRGGAISKVGIDIITASGNVAVAAYADNGSGAPGAQLSTSGIVACPAAAAGTRTDINLGATVGLAAGDWLAVWCDNTTAIFRCFNALNATGSIFDKRIAFENSQPTGPPATATPISGGGRNTLLVAT